MYRALCGTYVPCLDAWAACRVITWQVKSPLSEPSGPAETLADVLASGPLPLAAGLRCAHEIAAELRDLHQQTRAYGNLIA